MNMISIIQVLILFIVRELRQVGVFEKNLVRISRKNGHFAPFSKFDQSSFLFEEHNPNLLFDQTKYANGILLERLQPVGLEKKRFEF